MLALMQASLSGTQYVYQGQEIGAVNMPKESYPVENYLDLDSYLFMNMVKERYGADNKEEIDRAFTALSHLARDHARVPMPWDGNLKYGGFSDVAEKAGKEVQESWMKPHPLAGEINVASQLDDPDSVLAFWRKMLRFRRDHADLLVYGDYQTLRLDDEDLHFFTKHAVGTTSRALVVLNFTTGEKTWTAPDAKELGLPEGTDVTLRLVASSYDKKDRGEALAPFEGRVYLIGNQ
jgi:oligo-1,6-glucosidase